MEFSVLSKLINDQSDMAILSNLSSDKLDEPVMIQQIMEILSDEGHYILHISGDKALSLFRLAKEYFNTCWGIYLDSTIGGTKLEKMIDYSERIIYHTSTANGIRVSTVSEVKNGIEELEAKVIKELPDEITEYLNLLIWTFTGQLRYYKRAGLSYTYTDGKLDDTPYQLICKAGQKLRGMIDWISISGNYERALAVLKLSKKNSKYKYPVFATDEITPELSPKQIQYLCNLHIQGRGATEAQIETKKLLFKIEKNKYKALPHDIAMMRRAYSEIQSGVITSTDTCLDNTISELLNKLYSGAKSGVLKKDHFVFKVAKTIEATGKCSEKQMAVLRSAEIEMNKAVVSTVKEQDRQEKEAADEANMRELFELSEALGAGVLEV